MLHAEGVFAGDDLMQANEFNKAGHFESEEVVNLHDRIMSESGADWTSPLSLDVKVSKEQLSEMKDYVARRSKQKKFWCLKDPRQTRFLHEWKSIAPGLKFVIIYRDPAESVFSLQRRHMQLLVRSCGRDEVSRRFSEDTDLGAVLWRDHNRALLEFARRYPDDCVVVSHSAVVQGLDVLTLLSEKFLLDIPSDRSEVSTIDRGLVTKNAPVLNIKESSLIDDIEQIWNGLAALDASEPERGTVAKIKNALQLDPTGTNAENSLMRVQLSEANRVIASNNHAAKANARIAKLSENVDHLQVLLRDARKRPLKCLRRKILFKVLRLLAKASPPLSPRTAERFMRSAVKRDPSRNSLIRSIVALPKRDSGKNYDDPVDFDPVWYLETYPDVSDSLYDPLEHYLEFGRAEGRRANATHLSSEVTSAHLEILKVPEKVDEVVLFVTFAPEGKIKPHVAIYLEALKKIGLSIVLIIAADDPDAVVATDLIDMVDGLFVRQNGGFDFAAWAHVARHIDLSEARLVCVANDSLVGPFTIEGLRQIMDRAREADAELIGLTNSFELKEHFQSYFLVAKRNGVQTLLEFLATVRMLEDKWQVIFSHEIQMLDFFHSKGLRTLALFPSFVVANRSIHHWRELIDEGFPFIKMEVLRTTKDTSWKVTLSEKGYDCKIAEESMRMIESCGAPKPEEDRRK